MRCDKHPIGKGLHQVTASAGGERLASRWMTREPVCSRFKHSRKRRTACPDRSLSSSKASSDSVRAASVKRTFMDHGRKRGRISPKISAASCRRMSPRSTASTRASISGARRASQAASQEPTMRSSSKAACSAVGSSKKAWRRAAADMVIMYRFVMREARNVSPRVVSFSTDPAYRGM